MKKLLGIMALCFVLNSCGDRNGDSDYNMGYDDGYTGNTPKKNSNTYLDGYKDGEFDGECEYYKQNKELQYYVWDKYLKCDI
jgi:hypothetical protein